MRVRIVEWIKLIIAIILMAAGTVASAQQTASLAPDDRYAGYPRSLVEWPTAQPDLVSCVAQEFYEPLDVHLTQYVSRVKVAGERVQQEKECTWMLTRNKWRWVLRPKGTKVAVDAQGRDLFDYGSPTGQKCANPRPISISITPPQPASIPVAEVTTEQTPPASPTCQISGDHFTGYTGAATNGTGQWSLDGTVQENIGLVFRPTATEPGTHTVEFRVRGEGGEAVCERKFDVFAPRETNAVNERPVPEIKKGRCGTKCKVAIIGGLAVGGVLGGKLAFGGKKSPPPQDLTKPPSPAAGSGIKP